MAKHLFGSAASKGSRQDSPDTAQKGLIREKNGLQLISEGLVAPWL